MRLLPRADNSGDHALTAPSSSTKTTGACLLCRNRKLRCDRNPRACWNCQRSKEVCIAIDAISGRQYKRSYVDDLNARVKQLRELIKDAPSSIPSIQASITGKSGMVSDDAAGQISPFTPATYNGTGSVYSLGQLVAAAVSEGSASSVRRLGSSMAREQYTAERIRAKHADWPTMSVARQLVTS